MIKTNKLIAALLCTLTLSLAGCAHVHKEEILQIYERPDAYELNVPISKVVAFVPKKGLSLKDNRKGGGTDNPRYFYFKDESKNLIISGWFEPAQKYTGAKAMMEKDMKSLAGTTMPPPKDISYMNVGNWDAVMYDHVYPGQLNSHVRAHWLQAGTWIDVHISITSRASSSENRKEMLDLLKAIQVKENKS